jgi:hypothetical protein
MGAGARKVIMHVGNVLDDVEVIENLTKTSKYINLNRLMSACKAALSDNALVILSLIWLVDLLPPDQQHEHLKDFVL